jgi:tetraacyldisaccharide 4'-kinase
MMDREYYMRVISGEARGAAASAARAALSVLSGLYLGGLKVRRAAYDAGLARAKRVDAKVVSIGNITTGGTGKTPATIYFAREYLARGLRVVVLSRGYGRSTPADTPLVVSDGIDILLSPAESGDEPRLIAEKLAEKLAGVPVVVCGDRVRGAELAIEKFGAELILLDDGFQHAAIARDEDIVLIDCANPFGFGKLLPRGLLREPLSALKRATRFVLTRADGCDCTDTIAALRGINPDAPVNRSRHNPVGLVTLDGERREELDSISGGKVLAVSSIGNPEAFEKTLSRLGADVARSLRFADHHDYTDADADNIMAAAKESGAEYIIGTEKDGVRLRTVSNAPKDMLLLEIEFEMMD